MRTTLALKNLITQYFAVIAFDNVGEPDMLSVETALINNNKRNPNMALVLKMAQCTGKVCTASLYLLGYTIPCKEERRVQNVAHLL